MDSEILEAALTEMDHIFGSRDRTWEILFSRFIDITFGDQLAGRLARECQDPNKLLWTWTKWRRALRKVPGYEIVYGRDVMHLPEDRDKIDTIWGPDDEARRKDLAERSKLAAAQLDLEAQNKKRAELRKHMKK